MHHMNIAKHRCMHYLSIKENWSQLHYLIIPFDSFKMKMTIKTKIQKDIYIISNLFLNFFNRLIWHHSSYSHIPIPYNHEIINIII
jgi:hypothetical protein